MTFWYLPMSIDTNFLVVYEPYRALEGLQGVGFQCKNCLTKMASNYSETDDERAQVAFGLLTNLYYKKAK